MLVCTFAAIEILRGSDPVEIKTFYDDLIAAGHDLGVSMPVMESYADAIRRFAMTA